MAPATIGGFSDGIFSYALAGTLPPGGGTDAEKALFARMVGLGTGAEIMQYWGTDPVNNLILNVERKSQSSTSGKHLSGDLVFKGKLSAMVAPAMLLAEGDGGMPSMNCYLDPLGRVVMASRQLADDGTRPENTTYAYAQYQATLVRSVLMAARR
jgi:hypothetical protein